MTRSWSIRARTAVVFAVASVVLTTAVLVFVNLASQASYARELLVTEIRGSSAPTGAPLRPTGASPVPSAPSTGQPVGTGVALVRTVATLQWQWSAVGVGVAGLLAGAVGWAVSRRMLRPVDTITETTTRLSASNLHERIALGGPDDELRRLADTIDALIARLEGAFESQRRFVAQASHELRTPLAVQRAALQIALPDDATPAEIADARETLLAENRRTERLVESLLVLAEADRDVGAERVPVDVDELVADVVATVAAAARAAEVTVGSEVADGLELVAEPVLVRQLLLNLVDNAVEYNVPGGAVRVRVDRDGIVVENSGPDVRPADLERLTEPFQRAAATGSHRHSGLGLSIVAAVARAHGWSLDLAARDGGGLVATVRTRPAAAVGVSAE